MNEWDFLMWRSILAGMDCGEHQRPDGARIIAVSTATEDASFQRGNEEDYTAFVAWLEQRHVNLPGIHLPWPV